MKLTVYLDILILINTLINYFIIRIASLISSYNISFYRGLSAALCSSFFSLYIFAESSSALFTVTVKAVSLIAAIFLCTGKINLKHNLKFTLFFFTANAVFTGILFFFMQDTDFVYINNCFYYININPVSLVVCVMIAWIIITLVSLYSGISTQKECCEFTIFYGGKSVALKGFYDTGFLVKDYLSYRAVMLCGLPQIEDILPEKMYSEIKNYSIAMTDSYQLYPVFYSDISGGGVLPAIRPEKVVCNNREIKNTLIAIADKSLAQDIRLIYGKDIKNMIEV